MYLVLNDEDWDTAITVYYVTLKNMDTTSQWFSPPYIVYENNKTK